MSDSSFDALSCPADKEKSDSKLSAPKFHVDDRQLGIWKLRLTKYTGDSYPDRILPLIQQVLADVYYISPWLFLSNFACLALQSVENPVSMYLSEGLLRRVEITVRSGKADTAMLVLALSSRVAWRIISGAASGYLDGLGAAFDRGVYRHFTMKLMEAELKTDLTTAQEAGRKSNDIDAEKIYMAICKIIELIFILLELLSGIALISHFSRTTGGPVVVLLCLLKPLYITIFRPAEFWQYPSYAYISNPDFLRMSSLEEFGGDEFKQDVISNNLGGWILLQYRKAVKNLGDTSTDDLWSLSARSHPLSYTIIPKLLVELPMMYCIWRALSSPSQFSLASLTVLQSAAASFSGSLNQTVYVTQRIGRSFAVLRKAYEKTNVENVLKSGAIPYPNTDPADEKSFGKGMGFELRNVSFGYPGSEKKTPALSNISLSIQPGQLVIIVGANGSGKSTLIRLLSRLYDPTSGEICIDGRPSKEYKLEDLHRASVLLNQDAKIYPLTLAENIGLGYPQHLAVSENGPVSAEEHRKMIEEAAREGGADGFINKLELGLDSELKSFAEMQHFNLQGKTHPFWSEVEAMKKKSDLSGGEKQRIVAARSFMRFKSGKINFVAVDEPSSALDAEGELQLFERLIDSRKGKTMVFVTHRFGHLTKHADLIICMKDGNIVEQGNHKTLMGLNREYANLYQIQAQAFTPDNGGT